MELPITGKKCVFYTIGEFNRRKNFVSLIRAYYKAFRPHDNVLLIIKTSVPGQDSQNAMKQVTDSINGIKEQVRLACRADLYPPILIQTDHMTTSQMHSLHETGDVFVTASRGEAGCLPAMEAMRFCNPVIASNWGNLPELLDKNAWNNFDSATQEFKCPKDLHAGWLTPGQLIPCFGMEPHYGPKYLGNELWFDVNIPVLSNQLEEAYEHWTKGTLFHKRDAAEKRIEVFDLPKVGKIIKEALGED